MPRTITALYDSPTNAHAAIDTLATTGVPRSAMELFEGALVGAAGRTGAHEPASLPPATSLALQDASLAREERDLYEAALRRGSVLLRLRVEETEAARALNTLRDHGAVDLDARLKSWRQEGWGGTSPVATEGWGGYSATSTGGKGIVAHAASDAEGNEAP